MTNLLNSSIRRYRPHFNLWHGPTRYARSGFSRCGVLLSLLIWATGVSAASLPLIHPSGMEVHATPNPVSNGRTVLLEINTGNLVDRIVGIQAWYGTKAIPVYRHPRKGSDVFIGFVGVSYYQKPDTVSVKLEWTNSSGYHFLQIPIEVSEGQFKKEKLRVPKRKVSPSTDDRRRITGERSKIKEIYTTPEPSRLWYSAFAMPAGGIVTSPFGSRRLMNGRLKSYHNGVDFRAATGTPVYAANDGIVRLASNLFYSGNHLIIDHGLGIFSGYSHLSAFSVEPGQRVHKGQEIGLAGATGRVNGPHLHYATKVNGINVDPLQLMELIGSLFTAQEALVMEPE
jgi:hypothetical protein